MKKLLLLLSVASLVNAMEQEPVTGSEQPKLIQQKESQAPKVITMGDHMEQAREGADKYLEYAADCGCLASLMSNYLKTNPQAEPFDFATYLASFGFMDTNPRTTAFSAGFVTAELSNYLPTWASITSAVGVAGAYKLIERKFNKVKELTNKEAE